MGALREEQYRCLEAGKGWRALCQKGGDGGREEGARCKSGGCHWGAEDQ